MQAISDISQAEWLATQPQDIVEAFFDSLDDKELLALPYTWDFWARPKQLAPAWAWQYWILLAGRGFGKTRTICEWAIQKAIQMPESRGAIVGATAADVRDTLVEGESGILACSAPDFMPTYESSKRRLTWPNGTIATLYAAEKPDRLRGPQHHWAICDELAAWKYLETWDMLMFGMRLGDNPQTVIATTPRPLQLIKEIIEDESTAVTTGSTYENKANLANAFFKTIIKKYEGTRLGQQELEAVLLWDVPGALWKLGTRDDPKTIEGGRVSKAPALKRIVVSVDPPGTTAECGITVTAEGEDGHGYLLDDRSLQGTPAEWGAAVVKAYHDWNADIVVAEANQGGEMVRHTIQSSEGGKNIPVKLVWASRGKRTRAEPISTLYERGMMHHVGAFATLESQMTMWVPGDDSPDRMDSLVWGFTELFIGANEPPKEPPKAISKASKWRRG